MLQERLAALLPGDVTVQAYKRLARALLRWLCREGSIKEFSKQARLLGIQNDAKILKADLQYSRMWASQFWRAVWLCISAGMTPEEAAERQGVYESDLWWALSMLSTQQRTTIAKKAREPFILDPDYDAIVNEVQTIAPYCKSSARKLDYVTRYDDGLTNQDLVSDMIQHGYAAVYRYDAKISDVVHLRNIAWKTAFRRCNSLASYYSRAMRARVRKVTTTVGHAITRVFGRTACRQCGAPSKESYCAGCLAGPITAPGREKVEKYLARTSEAVRTIEPVKQDSFVVTTVSLNAPSKPAVATTTLLDNFATPAYQCDTELDLQKLPSKVQKICRLIVGTDVDAAFDAWLHGRHNSPKGPTIAREACRYYGVPFKLLRAEVGSLIRAA